MLLCIIVVNAGSMVVLVMYVRFPRVDAMIAAAIIADAELATGNTGHCAGFRKLGLKIAG